MTREEAAQLLWRVAYDKYGLDDDPTRQREAADIVVAALREPAHEWVRTADRLPENRDDLVVGLFLLDDGRTIPDTVPSGTVKRQIKMCPYWMPLPKLLEVDDD